MVGIVMAFIGKFHKNEDDTLRTSKRVLSVSNVLVMHSHTLFLVSKLLVCAVPRLNALNYVITMDRQRSSFPPTRLAEGN